MAFKPKSASLPFQKNLSTGNSKGFQQRPKDRLCVVERYDVAAGVVVAKEIDSGRIFETKIDQSKSTGGGTRPAADRWNGNMIDERMASKLPAGSWIVLEGCKVLKRNRTTEVSQAICNWIATPPEAAPEKAFSCIYSVSLYNDHVTAVQVWDKKAIDPATDEGEMAVLALGQEMDKINELYAQKKYPVNLGVQFRTKVPELDSSGAVIGYTIVDCTPPFDWIKPERDANNNIIQGSGNHPMTSEFLNEYLVGYMDYVYGSEDPSSPDAQPGLVAAGIIPHGSNPIVEVMPYKSYTGAPLSEHLSIKSEKSPLYRLGNHLTKYSKDENTVFSGKNWGVDGIVFLTQDEVVKKPGSSTAEVKPRNMVSRLFSHGYTANIHTLVESSDGLKVKVDPGLVVASENTAQENKLAAEDSSAGLVFSSASVVGAESSDPFSDDDNDAGDFNFEQSITGQQAPAVAAPAPAPPVPEAKEEIKPEPGKPAGKLFRRGTT